MEKRKAKKRALLPDLLALPPEDLHIEAENKAGKFRKLLRLSQSFGNLGPGPLQVRRGNSSPMCPGRGKAQAYQDIYFTDGTKKSYRLRECMIYHPQHKHWHVVNIARYDLCQIDSVTGGPGKPLASSDKISFCIVDTHRLDSKRYKGPSYSRRYSSCSTRISGITPGWADLYDYSLYGQWIDITGIKDGTYYLRTTINPKRLLMETKHENNAASVKIKIYNGGRSVAIIK
ncbi:lysyl oxidase family protein [Ammoniphilus sp. 3BR4]|uniref:lysyl oxidase family protein n=1 Tax=Ammoniphilus sp. 3BR4 TaxID=3158265 RepID=UPI003466B210